MRAARLLRSRAGRLLPAALLLLSASTSASSQADTPGVTALSVQGCNTRCQSEQTDCFLRCDGETPCIRECQKAADSCTDQCTKR